MNQDNDLVRGLLCLYNAPTLNSVSAMDTFEKIVSAHADGLKVWEGDSVTASKKRRSKVMTGLWTMSDIRSCNHFIVYRFLEDYLKEKELSFVLSDGGYFCLQHGNRDDKDYYVIGALPKSDEPGTWEYFRSPYVGFMTALCQRLTDNPHHAYISTLYGNISPELITGYS